MRNRQYYIQPENLLNSRWLASVNAPGGSVPSLYTFSMRSGARDFLFFSPFQTHHKTIMMVLWRASRTIRLNPERFRIFAFIGQIFIYRGNLTPFWGILGTELASFLDKKSRVTFSVFCIFSTRIIAYRFGDFFEKSYFIYE